MPAQLKDILLDIVRNTALMTNDKDTPIKITGTENSTIVQSIREDMTVIMNASLNQPHPDLIGVIGLEKLSMLSGLLNFSGFKNKEAKVRIKKENKKNIELSTEIIFEAPSVAAASFRLMAESVIPKQCTCNETKWPITIEQPSKTKISEFAQLAGIYSNLEDRFSIQVKNRELVFYIGKEDASSHKAKLIFAENIDGEIPSGCTWRIKDLINVLKLSDGAKTSLRINHDGSLIQILIDTGLCNYEFTLRATN